MEKTFLAVKPDAMNRGEAPHIIQMLAQLLPDSKCISMKIYTPTEELAKEHYAALSDKPFFPELIRSFTSGPILGMVWEGENVVSRAREAMGATNPEQAAEGTVRKVFGKSIEDNAIHGSDTEAGSAEREISIHFPEAQWRPICHPARHALGLMSPAGHTCCGGGHHH